GRPFWYLNGAPLRQSEVLTRPGRYQLLVVDEAGNSDRLEFLLEHPG
ncbi:hypothetical protein, partial [Aeromonas schubertii]